MRPLSTMWAACLVAALPGWAAAQGWVAFLHTPPEAQPEGVELVLEGSLIGVGPMQRVEVRYRRVDEGEWQTVPVTPSHGDVFRAVVPAARVRPPGIEYFVVLRDGTSERPIFASMDAPQRVRVGSGREPEPPRVRQTPTDRTDPGDVSATRPDLRDRAPPPERPAPVAALDDPFAAEQRVGVSGTRGRSVTEAPAIVSVVSAHQIRAMGARTLADVLKSVPGLETSRDVQGFHQVAVRGIRSDAEVLLLYDGQRMDSLYDGRKLYEIPVEHIDRVEILRGPGATLHGTGAFLAVINVIPVDAVGFTSAGSLDTHGLASLHAGWGMDVGEGRIRVEGDLDAGRGYRSPIVNDALNRDVRSVAGYTDDSRLLFNLGARGRHPAGPGQLHWTVRGLHQDRAALLGAFDTVGPDSQLAWTVLLGGLRYHLPVAGAELSFGLSGDLQRTDRRFQLTPHDYRSDGGHLFPEGVVEVLSHRTEGVGLDATAQMELFEGNVLSVGLVGGFQALGDWDYAVNLDPGTGQPLDAPLTPPDVAFPAHDPGLTRRGVLALYALDEWRIVDSLELTVGFRGDFFLGGVGRDDPAAPVGERGSEFSLSPRLGLVFTPSEAWSLKALHATAFRVPTFEELTSTLVQGAFVRGRFQGNPNLAPVRIRTSEVAVEHGFTLADRAFRLRANAFYNEFLGRIEAVDLTGNVTPLFNREGAINVLGAEGEGRVIFGPRDWISGGMAWFRAIDTQAPGGRNLLTTVPQLRLVLRSQVGLGPWLDLHVGAVFGSERRNNARSSLEALRRYRIPAYALVDTTLQTRPVADRVSFGLTVQNLLDTPYQDDVPRPDRVTELLPGPGMSARFTARLQW
jgi:outer membrane receptor for ferrienterochelin and colicin